MPKCDATLSKAEATTLAESALGPSLLAMSDIADHLGVTKRTIQAWRADGGLPPPDFAMGKVVRWRRATIETWIKRRAATGGSP